MKKVIKNAVLGTDPELFLYSEDYFKFVPVCGLVGGTKDKPIPINLENNGFTLQEDNVALEFTIPPASTKNEWIDSINFVKNYITETVLTPKGLVPRYVGSARFEPSDLDNPAAQHMGCSSSYDAWTFEQHYVDRDDYTLRTTGMHIHVGYEDPDVDVSIDLVRAMDLFLGVPSVFMDPDTERRKMYGKAGDYRLKGYGVEYRVLSGYFLGSNELLSWLWDATQKAIDFVNAGGIITNPEDIIKAINNCDKELAKEILEDYNIKTFNYEQV